MLLPSKARRGAGGGVFIFISLLLLSCSTDAEQETAAREPIRFTAGGLEVAPSLSWRAGGEATRATSSDDLQQTTFAKGKEVAVYVVGGDASTYTATPYQFRAESAADGKNVLNYTGGTLLYPPDTSSTIDVYAFYPYSLFRNENRTNTSFAVSVATDQSGIEDYQTSDVMRATPVLNHSRYPKASSTIHLQFDLLLAQVIIRLKQGQHKGSTSVHLLETELAGSTITLGNNDISTTATINLSTGNVTTTGSAPATITITKDCNLGFYDSGKEMPEYAIVLPPQDISGKALTIRTGFGRAITGILPTMAPMTGGNGYVLNVTVNDTRLTVIPAVSIGDWTKYNWNTDEDE